MYEVNLLERRSLQYEHQQIIWLLEFCRGIFVSGKILKDPQGNKGGRANFGLLLFEYLEYKNYRLPEYGYIYETAKCLLDGLAHYSSNSSFNKNQCEWQGNKSPDQRTNPQRG